MQALVLTLILFFAPATEPQASLEGVWRLNPARSDAQTFGAPGELTPSAVVTSDQAKDAQERLASLGTQWPVSSLPRLTIAAVGGSTTLQRWEPNATDAISVDSVWHAQGAENRRATRQQDVIVIEAVRTSTIPGGVLVEIRVRDTLTLLSDGSLLSERTTEANGKTRTVRSVYQRVN